MEGTPTGVVAKIARLLGAFGSDSPAMGLAELVRRTGLPKTTVHRLANELTAAGLLSRAGTHYVLGSRLFELGQLVPDRRSLREAALPFLEDVFVATRETVHLAVIHDRQVMYIERLAGHGSRRTPSSVAGHLPIHTTATGKALLAHASPEFIDDVCSRGLPRRTQFTLVTAEQLRGELVKIRGTGIAIEREETRLGYVSVAAPVFGRDRTAVAAISVTGLTERIDPDHVTHTVRSAARGLTRVLQSCAAT